VSKDILVQFMGFQVTTRNREYTFLVRESSSETREFTLTISNEAFDGRRARFQDAPDICSIKLHRELAIYANHPPETHYLITDADLDDYRSRRGPISSRNRFGRKPEE
jgi:hypothetical protein